MANQINTFGSLPVGSVFRFDGDTGLPGSGCFLHQNVYRKTSARCYTPADTEAAERSLRYLYSGYPDILKTFKGAHLKKALTLKVGSISALVTKEAING